MASKSDSQRRVSVSIANISVSTELAREIPLGVADPGLAVHPDLGIADGAKVRVTTDMEP